MLLFRRFVPESNYCSVRLNILWSLISVRNQVDKIIEVSSFSRVV